MKVEKRDVRTGTDALTWPMTRANAKEQEKTPKMPERVVKGADPSVTHLAIRVRAWTANPAFTHRMAFPSKASSRLW